MNILIVEDEIPAAQQLQTLLLQQVPSATLVAVLDSQAAIRDWLASNPMPDLIFSDIELLDGPVFPVWTELPQLAPIIFTTAYDAYMLEAFETQGIAYLLKPLDPNALRRALDKYQQLKAPDVAATLQQLLRNWPAPNADYKRRLTVRLGGGIYILKVDEITCLRMQQGVPHAFRQDGKAFPLSEPLSQILDQLDPRQFFLINRSEAVHVEAATRIEPYFNDRLAVHIAGQAQPLYTSAAKTAPFRAWLQG